jgi:hypothetical protein
MPLPIMMQAVLSKTTLDYLKDLANGSVTHGILEHVWETCAPILVLRSANLTKICSLSSDRCYCVSHSMVWCSTRAVYPSQEEPREGSFL